jgi:C4-dicarboxylate-specific signal transduction histidine kinase
LQEPAIHRQRDPQRDGIDPAARDELFTPFFTTKREGRGLGLTIVSEILNNHRLPFTLQNREGGGAEFRVSFT